METRETISLDSRAQQRLYVLNHILAGALTTEEASRVLRLSVRQVRRLLDRYGDEGAAALVHGNRGRVPANRTDPAIRARLVELATTEFAGFNPVHLAETLAEEGQTDLAVSARTIRRILAAAGTPLPRTRRSPRHRSRRERMARAGILLQTDASRHDWLEGRGPMLTLVGAIDDATGIVTAATFRPAEDAAGYLEVLRRTVATYGRPLAIYSDHHGIFIKDPNRPPTLAEQLRTAPGGGLDARGRQRRARALPAPPQSAVRHRDRRSRTGLARLAGRTRARGGLWLLLYRPGGQRCDDRLGRRQPGAAAAGRRSLMGRSDGHRRGAARRQPVGRRRRAPPTTARGATRRSAPASSPQPTTGSGTQPRTRPGRPDDHDPALSDDRAGPTDPPMAAVPCRQTT